MNAFQLETFLFKQECTRVLTQIEEYESGLFILYWNQPILYITHYWKRYQKLLHAVVRKTPPAVLLQWVLFFFLWTLLYSHLCPPGRMPGICLSVSLFNVSDVLHQSLAGVPAAWTGQTEQVERETESLEKAQLSEIQCRGLRRCQTLSLCLTFC